MMKYAFCFMLKALFVLKIFKFLSGPFDHVSRQLNNRLMTSKLCKKQLQCIYCAISEEVKAVRIKRLSLNRI